jgi:hypothetical protein
MLKVGFFRTPPIRQLVQHDFLDFHVGIVNPGHTPFVKVDVHWGYGRDGF